MKFYLFLIFAVVFSATGLFGFWLRGLYLNGWTTLTHDQAGYYAVGGFIFLVCSAPFWILFTTEYEKDSK
jgi:hypothetical protein